MSGGKSYFGKCRVCLDWKRRDLLRRGVCPDCAGGDWLARNDPARRRRRRRKR